MEKKEEEKEKMEKVRNWNYLRAICPKPTCVSPQSLVRNSYCLLFINSFAGFWASLVAQMVKNPPAVQEIWPQSLSWEDPLEEGMATHSSILAWSILMDRGAWQTAVHEVEKSWTRLNDKAQHYGLLIA